MLSRAAFIRHHRMLVGFAFLSVWSVLAVYSTLPAFATDTTVVVLLDDSGSMRNQMRTESALEPRMAVAKTALTRVVEQLSPQTTFGLLLMNGARSNGGWLVPLAALDRASALSRIANVKADGGTPLGQSMKSAIDELLERRGEVPYGDYRLLVVTDGEATDRNTLDQYLPDMVARGIVIDVIGVDMQSDHSLASRAHSYRRANDASSFEQALTEIFAESADSSTGSSAANFDMIAGLPDDFAAEALKALATSRNQKISVSQTPDRDTSSPAANAPIGPATTVTTPNGPTPTVPPVQEDRGFSFGFFLAVVVFLIILINGLTKSKR
ncbi:MAG: VWA domain-containing protein [Planctomycetota bacterium]|nr:VWA domain-containing protein [Planctomycetota bacterium]